MFKSVNHQFVRSLALCSSSTHVPLRGYARRGHIPFYKRSEFVQLDEYDVADESEIISDLDQIEDQLLRSKADKTRFVTIPASDFHITGTNCLPRLSPRAWMNFSFVWIDKSLMRILKLSFL